MSVPETDEACEKGIALDGPGGYLSGDVISPAPCIFNFEASPGQQIAVTLYDFHHSEETGQKMEYG